MKEDFKTLEQIEKYLTGKLEGAELVKFEDKIKKDRTFSKVVESFRISLDIAKLYGRLQLKTELGKIHKKLVTQSHTTEKSIESVSSKVSKLIDILFDKYFTPYDDVVTVRSKRKGILEDAMREYSSGNYGAAIKLYKSILKDKPKDVYALFYCGISLLEVEKFTDAKSKFSKLLRIDENIFRDQTEWYLGLTYLKSNNVSEAMIIFNGINKDNREYRKARNIIKKLEEASN
jgi:tetratricopeptide (TPR) repeat protein